MDAIQTPALQARRIAAIRGALHFRGGRRYLARPGTRCSPATSPQTLTRAPSSALRPAPELSVVVPTFNERANVPILVERLARVLAGSEWEVLFVDDNSPDGTAAVARALGETDGRVRCMRRIGRRGLAGACLEGTLASPRPLPRRHGRRFAA